MAAGAGLREVRLWEGPMLPLPDALGTRIRRDDDALAMLLPFSPEVRAAGWSNVLRALWI